MKYQKAAIALLAMVCLSGIAYAFVGNPVVLSNNKALQKAITAITSDRVALNEVVPFGWDVVYTIDPYVGKEQIEQAIGFKSTSIQENNINEGMVHLLFVHDEKVVASILGYGENLGYRLDFSEKRSFSEQAMFDVSTIDGVVILSQES